MRDGLSDFYIDPEFISKTEKYLSEITPFSGISPAGYSVNYVGVYVDTKYFQLLNPDAHEAEKQEREVSTGCPDIQRGELYFEGGSLLAAINDAKDNETFNMIELGGGWGARAVTAHAMLKNLNLDKKEFYIIVEAMSEHCNWIREHMQGNGLDPRLHSIIHAAIWIDNIPKLFPDCAGVLGQSIANNAPECVRNLEPEEAKESLLNVVQTGELGITEKFKSRHDDQFRKWSFVSSITLRDILLPVERIDYMDVDIQGAEEKVISEGVEILEDKVKRLHIGTHGLDMHHMLTDMFDTRDWHISVHIPPNGEYSTEWGEFKTDDGILSVVNTKII